LDFVLLGTGTSHRTSTIREQRLEAIAEICEFMQLMEHDEDKRLLKVVLSSLPPIMWVDTFQGLVRKELPGVTQERKNAAVAAIRILSETPWDELSPMLHDNHLIHGCHMGMSCIPWMGIFQSCIPARINAVEAVIPGPVLAQEVPAIAEVIPVPVLAQEVPAIVEVQDQDGAYHGQEVPAIVEVQDQDGADGQADNDSSVGSVNLNCGQEVPAIVEVQDQDSADHGQDDNDSLTISSVPLNPL